VQCGQHARLVRVDHLGTLGTGNHFIEACLDEEGRVWVMLHSGSRGVGNRIGTFFIELAKQDMRRWFIRDLPDEDLAYFPEGAEHFDDYWFAVAWAQDFAMANREAMLAAVLAAMGSTGALPPFVVTSEVVNCHHNYVAREFHYGANVFVTRKGAVPAREGQPGVVHFVLARGRSGRIAQQSQESLHPGGPRAGHGRCGVPQGLERARRDARRLQGH